jgi:hypothetical protein
MKGKKMPKETSKWNPWVFVIFNAHDIPILGDTLIYYI